MRYPPKVFASVSVLGFFLVLLLSHFWWTHGDVKDVVYTETEVEQTTDEVSAEFIDHEHTNIHDVYRPIPTIAKVSMLYGEIPRTEYVRALKTHDLHNQRYNYAMHVLRQDAVGGFWNKPFYLLSIIMQELSKPISERLQWLMWVDADLILVNPSIPLESFLPPSDLADTIHFIGGRDHNGLNTGTFFLRVSSWSVHMLNKALGLPVYHPEIELGNSFDQVAMSKVLSEDFGYDGALNWWEHENETTLDRTLRLSQLSRPFLFQPREWHNTYEFDTGYEGAEARNGHLLVHFPGLEEKRWKHMEKWLEEMELRQSIWAVPYENSIYAQQVPEYWKLVRKVRVLVRNANETLAYYMPESSDYTYLRNITDGCEGPLTNTSYSIGPGQDLLTHMRRGVDALSATLQEYLADEDAAVGNTSQ